MQVASTTRALKSLLNQHTFELLDDDDDHKLRLPPLGDWTMISQFDHLPWSSMAQEEEEPMFDQEGDADDTSATEVTSRTYPICHPAILRLQDEERILSQRLSQLSTKSDYEREPSRDGKRGRRQVPITDSVAKKVRTDPDQPDEQDRLPFYLSADNPHFNRIIRQSVEAASVLPVADLQQLAFCIHKTAELPIQEELWSAYLQCGTGGWWEKEEGQPLANRRHFWPQHVKSLISSQRSTFPSEMTDDDEQRACEYVVHQRLREIPNQLARYQTQYEEKQRKATSVLVEALEHLVREQAIVPLRLKVELALAVLRCDADDYWLQCQFQAEKPTPYQVRMRMVHQHCSMTIVPRRKWPSVCTRRPFNWSVLKANSRNAENVCDTIDLRPHTMVCKSRFHRPFTGSRTRRFDKHFSIDANNWFNRRKLVSWPCNSLDSKEESISIKPDSKNKRIKCGNNIVNKWPTRPCPQHWPIWLTSAPPWPRRN